MGSPIIPPGFCNIIVGYNSRGLHDCINEFGASLVGEHDQGTVDEISLVILSAYNEVLHSSSSTTFLELKQNFDGVETQFVSINGHGVGTRSGELCPPQVQVLARKQTHVSGRNNVGRTFFADPHEANVGDDGRLTSPEIGVWQDLCDAIRTELNNDDQGLSGMFILHSQPGSPTLVDSFNVQPATATLRRRFPRV